MFARVRRTCLGLVILEEMAQILDGKWVREQILAECKPRVDALATSHRAPGLVVVLVGNNPASEIYVRNKIKACAGGLQA